MNFIKINSTTRSFDVSTVCNALVDILIKVSDDDLSYFKMKKGQMHLVNSQAQSEILAYFSNKTETVELGGSSLNTIRTLAALGSKAMFAGMIANDSFGDQIKSKLHHLKIDGRLTVTAHDATGSCLVLVTSDGERTMNTCLGASRLYDEKSIPVADISTSKIFHFSGYQWDTEGQKKGIIKALDCAKKSQCIISFDLADPFVVSKNKQEFISLTEEYADILFANREESFLLYNLSAEETVQKVAENKSVAVVKLDKDGALIGDENSFIKVPALDTKIIDTTGAGDMFAAGFLYGVLNGVSLESSGKLATILASDVISHWGASVSQHAIDQVISAVESFQK